MFSEHNKVQAAIKALLHNWIEEETGEHIYKFSGGFWEILYPLMEKYEPELLKKYSKLIGEEFDYFNDKVRELLTTGDELKDVENAIEYYQNRIGAYAGVNDVHHIEDEENDETIPYMPNQNIDSKVYFGREDE